MGHGYYTAEVHGKYDVFKIESLDLEAGGRLRNLELAYATVGNLSMAKDNAILFPTWYSGTSGIIQQAYVGETRALDPRKYFIIIPNQIGNGLSSAPHNSRVPFNAAQFPRVSIGDDVVAQHKLVTEAFGISKLQLVLGGSMGAQQTYEWAVRFPETVLRAAPIAGTARVSTHNKLLVEAFKGAIESDPEWSGGWYQDAGKVHRGLRRHARLFALMGFTPRLFKSEGWRSLGFASPEDFVVGFVEGHFLPQDANNLLTMLRKWEAGDVSRNTGGCLKTALSRIKAHTTVIAIADDYFFPLSDIQEEQSLVPDSTLEVVSSDWGHLALFGIDPGYNSQVDAHLSALLGGKR
ncbi:MAG: alpha/beta fold hydrolase [Sphingomonadales bacterium]|nr:alpha/beta fold hydrolase [Sphingomonadales bacterium]